MFSDAGVLGVLGGVECRAVPQDQWTCSLCSDQQGCNEVIDKEENQRATASWLPKVDLEHEGA